MLRRLALAALLALPLPPAPAAEAAPVRWARNGHSYEAVHVPEGVTWLQAQAMARARGCRWHLATLTSAAEDRFAFRLLAGRPEFFAFGFGPWFGGAQRAGAPEPDRGWRWVTGEPSGYRHWKFGEPNNLGGAENRLQFWPNGEWNDEDDALLAPGFIAEFDPALSCPRWSPAP